MYKLYCVRDTKSGQWQSPVPDFNDATMLGFVLWVVLWLCWGLCLDNPREYTDFPKNFQNVGGAGWFRGWGRAEGAC